MVGEHVRVVLDVVAELGRAAVLEPGLEPLEYRAAVDEKVAPRADRVYRYLQFDELPGYGGKT